MSSVCRHGVILACLAIIATSCDAADIPVSGSWSERPHLPWAGNGTCGPPIYDSKSDETTVECLGPRHLLTPGQTIDVLMLLETPYPKNASVVVLSQTAQLVDDGRRPVSLSELYLHHYVSSQLFLLGNGAEIRGSYTRKVLPEPFALIVNGTAIDDYRQRLTNIQLINTVGLPREAAKPCLECWCKHNPFHDTRDALASKLEEHPYPRTDHGDPTHGTDRPESRAGSLVCCHQCPSISADAAPVGYHLQYNVTYKPLQPQHALRRTDLIGFDVTGGKIEYQIPEALGAGSTHVQETDTVYDQACPQKAPVDIVRCTGHQHFGGKCIELWNLDRGELICRTCPVFGSRPGVPGNESGYVVSIPDDDLEQPYTIAPGTNVRIKSLYDASVPRFGVMGLITTWAAGLPEPCYKPSFNNSISIPWHSPLFSHLGAPLHQQSTPAIISV